MKFFHIDDRTGKHSDTTARTWLLYLLFFLYALALAVAGALGAFGVIKPVTADSRSLIAPMELLQFLGYIAIGQGALYLGKRVAERKTYPLASEDKPSRKAEPDGKPATKNKDLFRTPKQNPPPPRPLYK